MEKSRFQRARRALIFWTLFIGIGAVGGAAMMLIDPSGRAMGMDAMLPYFQVLPFAEVVFQNYMFPLNFMSTSFFVFGLAQAATGWAAWVFLRQEAFSVNPADYPRVGANPRRLVVYFSRMGYGKRLAYEEAERTGAEIYELRSTERTAGTLGFWWCGRCAMHRWDMPIEPVTVDLTRYERVTICTPIWVFALAAPVRAFCRQSAGKIRAYDAIVVHHQNSVYENAVQEMDALLGIRHDGLRSVRCREERYKSIA